jgi:hypothetical protein
METRSRPKRPRCGHQTNTQLTRFAVCVFEKWRKFIIRHHDYTLFCSCFYFIVHA